MLELVPNTLTSRWLGYAALNPYARPSSAVSAEAQTVAQAASNLVKLAEASQVLFGGRAAAISRLRAMANECAEEGWDGEDARPIDPVALRNSEDLLRALPEDFPVPEFAPEPDGSISLDWIESRHRLFSMSVGTSNRLAYAWLDGADKGHGVARFDGFSLPSRILFAIRSIIGYDTSLVRLT
jgi:hypothetical protein